MTDKDAAPSVPEEQPKAADAQIVQPQAQEEETQDIDAQDLTRAIAAAEAEEAAAGQDGANAADAGTDSNAQQQSAAQERKPDAPIMVPKARLDEVLARVDKAAGEAAYWKGVADARGQQAPGQSGQSPAQQLAQQPTAEQRLGVIQAKQDQLAKKFDDGEITYSDLVREQRTLTNQEQAIREEILLTKVKPANQQPAPRERNDELYLNDRTSDLIEEHPWVSVFDQVGTAIDWKFIEDTARANLAGRGVEFNGDSVSAFLLREEAAKLCDQYGPAMVGGKAKLQGITLPGQNSIPAGKSPAQRPLSPLAQARQDKLNLAERQPPNLNTMHGTQGDPGGLPSDAQIEAMSEEQFDNLPDGQRRRLLGLS